MARSQCATTDGAEASRGPVVRAGPGLRGPAETSMIVIPSTPEFACGKPS